MAVFLYAVWPWLPGQRGTSRTVIVYGFSILGEVMNSRIFPAFQAEWQKQTGEHIEMVSAFAGSGTVTHQIKMGVPAQLAILATGLDAKTLIDERLATLEGLPEHGVVNRTPFVILTRPGNPRGIRDFADLAEQEVAIVHPDPLTSGGAQWAVLAEYASALYTGGSPEQAGQRLEKIWRHVVSQASSAQSARTQFNSGLGDALVTYEQDLLRDARAGRLEGEIVYPVSTILSEHTVVVIPRNVSLQDRPLVDAFAQFLWSARAQELFAEAGFRSVDERYNLSFRAIEKPFTIDDLGGWPRARTEIIEAIWQNKVLAVLGK
ncbi:MAG: substrate-binding domain-containing protein [Candidatus Eremiobacteraeota bacterium]|nr:substrate-binding domain-containing protein [Candidatus Eremiobacteraeota bacterium]MCW5870065.1 substrate-binding domain-containing protein [Candidatus Eremiobacteraeota bacterium]